MTPVFATAPASRDVVVRFVGAMIPGGSRGFGECVAMAVLGGNGRLVSGVLFHNWNPENGVIEISAASVEKRWLTRPVLWAMFNYTFNDAGCQLVVMRVSERNRTENGRGIQRILKAYGFDEYRIPRLQGRDTAELIYTLTDDVWRAKERH